MDLYLVPKKILNDLHKQKLKVHFERAEDTREKKKNKKKIIR